MYQCFGADEITPAEKQALTDAKVSNVTKIFSTFSDSLSDIFGVTKSATGSAAVTPGSTTVISVPSARSSSPAWLIPAVIGGGALLFFMSRKK